MVILALEAADKLRAQLKEATANKEASETRRAESAQQLADTAAASEVSQAEHARLELRLTGIRVSWALETQFSQL